MEALWAGISWLGNLRHSMETKIYPLFGSHIYIGIASFGVLKPTLKIVESTPK